MSYPERILMEALVHAVAHFPDAPEGVEFYDWRWEVNMTPVEVLRVQLRPGRRVTIQTKPLTPQVAIGWSQEHRVGVVSVGTNPT